MNTATSIQIPTSHLHKKPAPPPHLRADCQSHHIMCDLRVCPAEKVCSCTKNKTKNNMFWECSLQVLVLIYIQYFSTDMWLKICTMSSSYSHVDFNTAQLFFQAVCTYCFAPCKTTDIYGLSSINKSCCASVQKMLINNCFSKTLQKIINYLIPP